MTNRPIGKRLDAGYAMLIESDSSYSQQREHHDKLPEGMHAGLPFLINEDGEFINDTLSELVAKTRFELGHQDLVEVAKAAYNSGYLQQNSILEQVLPRDMAAKRGGYDHKTIH